jgi:DNA-binding PadR family transcriptional regulator
VNSTRLFVLGFLARQGQMHGHQIRRAARIDRSDLWTDVKSGSLYGAIHRMEAEGLIRAVRTEQDGNLPARRVYEITPEGRRELDVQCTEALRRTKLAPDAIDLALNHAGHLAEEEFAAAIRHRRESYALQLTTMRQLRESADPYLTALERLTFQHTLMRLETEIAWHDQLLAQLPKLLADLPDGATARQFGDDPDA